MSEARHLTQAERCSLFLLDKQHKCLVAKVFDGSSGSGQWRTIEGRELGIPADQGIAGHVADTGQLLNISDAYSHPLFYKDVDKTTGFITRSECVFFSFDVLSYCHSLSSTGTFSVSPLKMGTTSLVWRNCVTK